jgi:hypothetical protein
MRSLALPLTLLALAAGCPGQPDPGGDDDDDAPAGDGAPPAPDAAPPDAEPLPLFSFFVTSLDTMRAQSGSQDGFGGDLGGLAGADVICQTAAANVGFGAKTWRAFLSVQDDGNGNQVDAIDRIGQGPWYDRNGRLIANDLAGLQSTRPAGDPQTVNDLPDEFGVPLHMYGDTHDVLTGSNTEGRLESLDPVTTCYNWTSAVGPGTENEVRCGHSWPAMSGQHWITAHRVRGCAPGVNLIQNGPGEGDCVGCGGGWGGIYCFALEP